MCPLLLTFVCILSLFGGMSAVLNATMVGAIVAHNDWVNAVDIGSKPKSPRSKSSAVDIRHKWQTPKAVHREGMY